MKVRILTAAMTGCMALAACGGSTEDNTMNADANLMTDMNAGMTDLNTTTDMNATTDMNGTMDMNATDNMSDMNTATDNTTNSY